MHQIYDPNLLISFIREKELSTNLEKMSLVNRKYQSKICGALRDLVPFVQFKKREKHPWRCVNFSKVAG